MGKACKDCGETKPLDEFYLIKQRPDGRSIRCKTCTSIMRRVYQMRAPRHQSPPGMKRCSACKTEKPPSEFSRNKAFHDGLDRTCRTCGNARSAKYSKTHRAQEAARQREWYRRNPNAQADIALKRRRGVPHGTYAIMLAEQGGVCAICGTDTPRGRGRFHLDHDATTGAIRGLLCNRCNIGIGQLRHDEVILLAAIKYLRERASI